ncbi:MAG: hypothetical protein K5868_02615 [Lachnospiraceae bacterium]|nr:hypothetical protein [Lachnospiraceae bacterium]
MNSLKKIIIKIIRITFDEINRLFRYVSKKLQNGFVEIIRVKTFVDDPKYNRIYYIYLLGKQIFPGKFKIYKNNWIDKSRPVFYFKVNRVSDYAKPCVQHWVNIAHEMNADFYFVCDNPIMEYMLLREVTFPGGEIKFVRSMKRATKKVCVTVTDLSWRKVGYAHLTPFYHAKRIGIDKYWAIDADDSMICLNYKRAAEMLLIVEERAFEDNISVISIDVWRSRSRGKHWCWGTAFVNNNLLLCNKMEENSDLTWTKRYYDIERRFNIDWFFTYLKDTTNIKIETFYVENMYYIHWGSFLRDPELGTIFYWNKGKQYLPILYRIFKSEELGMIDIADCIKIDIGVLEEESLFFFENEVNILRLYPPTYRLLLGNPDYGFLKKSLEYL